MATVMASTAIVPSATLGLIVPSSTMTASATSLANQKITSTEFYAVKETKIYDKAQISGKENTVMAVPKGSYLERLSAKKVKINGAYYVHAKFKGISGYVLASTVKTVKTKYSAYKKLQYARVAKTDRTVNVRNQAGVLSTFTIKKVLNKDVKLIVDGYRKVNSKKYFHVIYVAPNGKQTKGYIYSGYLDIICYYGGNIKNDATKKTPTPKVGDKVGIDGAKGIEITQITTTTDSNNTTVNNTNSNNTTINAENVIIQNIDTGSGNGNGAGSNAGSASDEILNSPAYYKDPKNRVPAPVYTPSYVPPGK